MNEVIEALLKLLQDNLGAKYKKYEFGENRVPESVFLPMIEVIPDTSSIKNRGTGGMLNNEFGIILVIKSTLKKYIGGKSPGSTGTLNYQQDLVKRVEERNADGSFMQGTIMKVLHDNLQLVINEIRFADINGDWNIKYGEDDLGDSYIVKATINFTVKRIT